MENPTKIDCDGQRFRGANYYWTGKCMQLRGQAHGAKLHNAVYAAWFSEDVRGGFHVRPRDGDYRNCAILNLELVRGTAQY